MRPLTRLAVAVACALAATVSAPALAQSGESGAQRSATDRLEQRVRRLENVLDSEQLVRLMQKIDALDQQIRELRGSIETQSHRLEEMRDRQRNLYSDLDRRLRELEVAGRQGAPQESGSDGGSGEGADSQGSGNQSAGDGSGSNADQPGLAPGQAGAPLSGAERADAGGSGGSESDDGADEQAQREAYNAAFELLKDGRYEAAAEEFRGFLGQYPDGPYSDNAQYWLGESYYVTRDFEEALQAFRQTAERYPDSAKVPDARLKIGYTLHELERYDEARSVLQEVISEQSGTVARLAEERLLRLQNQQGN